MKLRAELIDLLNEVVSRRHPKLAPVVELVRRRIGLEREEMLSLMNVIIDEIALTGFLDSDESVNRGLMLEEIGDYLGDWNKNLKPRDMNGHS